MLFFFIVHSLMIFVYLCIAELKFHLQTMNPKTDDTSGNGTGNLPAADGPPRTQFWNGNCQIEHPVLC